LIARARALFHDDLYVAAKQEQESHQPLQRRAGQAAALAPIESPRGKHLVGAVAGGAIGFAVLVSLEASNYSAAHAARLNPAQALRYEKSRK